MKTILKLSILFLLTNKMFASGAMPVNTTNLYEVQDKTTTATMEKLYENDQKHYEIIEENLEKQAKLRTK